MPNSKSRGPIGTVGSLLLYIPALLFMPFWELSKFLSKKAYGGSWLRGIFIGLANIPATIYAISFAYSVAAYQFDLNTPLSVLIAAASGAITAGIIWPGLYLVIFKPLWQLADKGFKLNRKFAEGVVEPLSTGVVNFVRALPGSNRLWTASEEKPVDGDKPGSSSSTRAKWGIKVLSGLLFVASLATGFAALYFVYTALMAYLPVFGHLPFSSGLYLSQVIAATVAAMSLVFVTGALAQYVEYGHDKDDRQSFTAIVYSAAAAFFAVTKLTLFAGLSLALKVPAAVVIFAGVLAYALPVVLICLQGGFVARVLKAWGKLLDAAYDGDEDKAFTLFFAQVANIVTAVVEGVIAYVVAGLIHLPFAGSVAVGVAAVLLSYAANPKSFKADRTVNPTFGIGASVLAGVAAYYFAPQAVASGFWHYAVTLASVATVGLLVYPVAYLGFRGLTGPLAPTAGPALAKVADAAASAYKVVGSRLSKLQRAAYDDSSKFSSLFGHLLILGLIAAGIWQGGIDLYWHAVGALSVAFWLKAVLTAFAAINVYMLLGKLSSSYSGETFSVGAGFAAGIIAGHWALGMASGNYFAAVVVGFLAAAFAGGVVAPAIYVVIRPVANAILTPWLAPLLNAIFDGIWAVYAGFWKRFAVLVKVLASVFAPVAAFFAAVWKGVADAYARITGRK
jgi:hypothetical protein